MRGGARAWVVVAVAAVLTSACGSSTRSNHEASKSPAQIVADSAAALRSAGSYALRGTFTQNGKTSSVTLVATGSNSLRFTLAQGAKDFEIIDLPGAFYARGNAAFWQGQAHIGSRAALLAGRWIQVPPGLERQAVAALGKLAPQTISRCLVENHGTLTFAGQATVAGRRAIIIKDAGDVPGSSPGELAVAATGSPYPLRVTGTGPTRPGGPIDVCNDGKNPTTTGGATLSQFGTVPPINRPANVLNPGTVS